MASTIVGMPFDQVKIQIQTNQSKSIKESVFFCYRNYGFLGFFRGLSVPFSFQGFIVGIVFYVGGGKMRLRGRFFYLREFGKFWKFGKF
jgi:hypothetical protein